MLQSADVFEYDPLISGAVVGGAGGLVLVGLVFNVILVRVLVCIKQGWGSSIYRLTVCVALVDISACLSALALLLIRSIVGYPEVIKTPRYCRAYGFSLFLSISISGILISLIGLERYLLIIWHSRLRPLYMWTVAGIIILLLVGLQGHIAYHGAYTLDPTFTYCVPKDSSQSATERIVTDAVLHIPLLVTSFCYVAIYLKIRRVQHAGHRQADCYLPLRALLIFFAYFICYLPKIFSTFYKFTFDAYPPVTVYILLAYGFCLVLIINPILVLFLNRQVYQVFISLFFPHPHETPTPAQPPLQSLQTN